MSSMDQAFVKAFARRTRSQGQPVDDRSSSVESAQTAPTNVAPEATARGSQSVSQPAAVSPREPGTLEVDHSVAGTAKVWVDPIEDQIVRPDIAASDVPKPHLDTHVADTHVADTHSGQAASGSVESLQHIHTAYATAFSPAAPSASVHRSSPVENPPAPPEAGAASPDPVIEQPARVIEQPALAAEPTAPAPPEAVSSQPSPPFVVPEVPVTHFELPVTQFGQPVAPAESPFGQLETPVADAPIAAPPTVDASTVEPIAPFESTAFEEHPQAGQPQASQRTADKPATEKRRPSEFIPVVEFPSVELPADAAGKELRVDQPPVETEPVARQPIVPFQAVWEVDVFDVPTSVADLFFEGTLFQQIADRMLESVRTGLNSVLVTSTKPGEGRSSVAIGMAMASAAAGIRVALVDADAEDPTLAEDLRLDLQYGWVDTIRGGLPIKEVAVHAIEDGVTLIPLMPPVGQTSATAFELVQLIELLKTKFELVIIDGPTGSTSSIHQCASAVDSAIIVRDVSRTDAMTINEYSYRLRESGVQGVGVVENYV